MKKLVIAALAFPWLTLGGTILAHCASDPYLNKTVECVNAAPTRAAADACRAALRAGDAGKEGGVPHG